MFTGFGANDIVAFVGVAGVSEFQRAMGTLGASADAAAKRVDKALTAMAAAGVAAFGASVAAAAQFEKGMQNVRSIISVSDENFEQLSQEVLDFARTTNARIPDVTKALYDLYSAGARVEDGMGALRIASKASIAGLTSLTTAIGAGMAAVNAYGDRLKALGGLSEQLSYIYDVQFETVRVGVLTYEQLASAIGNVLPSAATLGAALEEMHGALAALTRSGIDAQSAATYLARAFQNFVSERERFEELGVEIFDRHTGAFRGLVPVIGDLRAQLMGMTDAERMAALEALHLDARAAKAIYSMVGNWKMFKELMDEVADSVGAMGLAHEQNIQTFEYEARVLRNQLQVAFIELGQEPKEALRLLLHEINRHPEAIGAVVKSMGTAIITAGSLAGAYKAVQLAGATVRVVNGLMATSFGPVGLAVAGVVTALGTLKAAIDAHDAAEKRHREELVATITRLGELANRHDELRAKKEKTRLEVVALERAEKELRETLQSLGIQVDANTSSFSALADSLRTDAVARMRAEMEKLKERAAVMDTTAQQLAASTNGLAGVFAQWLARRDEKKIAELENAIAQLDGATMSYEKTQETLNALGVRTRGEIEAQIAVLENLLQSSHLELGQRQELEAQLHKQREALEKLTLGEKEAAEVSRRRRDVLKELNDIGIKTTAQIEAEIAKLRELIPYVASDELARRELLERIRDLQKEKNVLAQKYDLEVDTLGFLVPKQLEAAAGSARYARELKLVGEQATVAANSNVKLASTADRVAAAFGTSKENLAQWASLIRDILGEIPGAESDLARFGRGLATWAASGFNPFVGLAELASFAIGALRKETKEPLQIKLESFGFPEFMRESQVLLDRVAEINKGLAEAKEGTKQQKEWLQAVIELAKEAKKFEAFKRYGDLVQNFGDALDYARTSLDLFGAGAKQNAGAIEALDVYLEQAQKELATLPQGSEAWRQLHSMILQAQRLLAELAGTAQSAAASIREIGPSLRAVLVAEYEGKLRGLTSALEALSEEQKKFGWVSEETQRNFEDALSAAMGYFWNLAIQAPHSEAWYEFGQTLSQVYNEYLRLTSAIYESGEALKGQGTVIGDAIDHTGRLGDAALGAGRSFQQLSESVGEVVPIAKQCGDNFDVLKAVVVNTVPAVDSLHAAVGRLGDDFDALKATSVQAMPAVDSLRAVVVRLGDDFDAVPVKANEAAQAVGELGDIFRRTAEDVWSLDASLRGFYGYQAAQLDQFLRDVVSAEKMVAEMQRIGATFATTDVDERIRAMIARMRELLETIPPTAAGHWELVRAIQRLQGLLGETLPPLREYVQASRELGEIGGWVPFKGGAYHTGGPVRAHSGLYAWDEVPAILKHGEYVIRAEAVRAVGLETLNAINRGEAPVTPNVTVVVHEATPRTWAEIVEEHVVDRVTSRQRRAGVL